MIISILTLFPNMFSGPFNTSIVGRAVDDSKVTINLIDIREFGLGSHKTVDDRPYGGGVGMLMRVDVLSNAITHTKSLTPDKKTRTILLDPRGSTFAQKKAQELSKAEHLILVCGHYEGVDERVRDLVDETISIGDFITTGGEIPAMLITDAVTRLLPDVLSLEATALESFSNSLDNETYLEYPQYTQPREYNGVVVPDILLSGNHKEIDKWRLEQAKIITKKHRPDLKSVSSLKRT